MNPSLLPAATKLGQGNVFTGVCDSVHRGGSLAGRTPSGKETPLEQTPPRARLPAPWDQIPPGADMQTPPCDQTPRSRPPLGPDPPGSRPPWDHTPWEQTPREQTPLGADTPPPEADSSIRSTSGR